MTYLILRYSSLGNVAMMVPLIASLSENYPDDQFIVVCHKRLEDLFYGMDNVKIVAFEGLKQIRDNKHLYLLLKKQYKIDVVIDLQDIFHTHLLRFLFRMLGVKVVSVQPNRIHKLLLCLRGATKSSILKPEVERYRDAFIKAGLKTDNTFRSLKINEAARETIIKQFGKNEGRWIGIAPFAKHKTNTMPYQIMKELIERLTKNNNTQIFLFGAGEVECEMLRQWASIYKKTESVAGTLSMSEELELMRQLDVMICMDSANQHLASLVGLRTISIWCGTHKSAGFSAWKQNEKDIIERNLSCRPCTIHGKERCKFGNFLCKQISAEEIIKKI